MDQEAVLQLRRVQCLALVAMVEAGWSRSTARLSSAPSLFLGDALVPAAAAPIALGPGGADPCPFDLAADVDVGDRVRGSSMSAPYSCGAVASNTDSTHAHPHTQ